MPREIPELVRAAAGLAATVLDEARKLPETLPGLPVRVIGLAMQQAMRIQQQYAGLVARGDELFTGLRGENEPGLATFDDDLPAPSPGFRDSAFDRAGDSLLADTSLESDEEDLIELLEDEEADAVVDEAEAFAEQVEEAQQKIEDVVDEVPVTEAVAAEVLDEFAIDELVAETPAAPPAATKKAAPPKAAPPTTAAPAEKATPAKKATRPRKAAAEMAPPRGAAAATPTAATPTAETPVSETTAPVTPSPATVAQSLQAPATAPVDGYDTFSIAQLRGYLRGYAQKTVEELLAYEEAGLAREPYLRILRNRLERLRSDARTADGSTGQPDQA